MNAVLVGGARDGEVIVVDDAVASDPGARYVFAEPGPVDPTTDTRTDVQVAYDIRFLNGSAATDSMGRLLFDLSVAATT